MRAGGVRVRRDSAVVSLVAGWVGRWRSGEFREGQFAGVAVVAFRLWVSCILGGGDLHVLAVWVRVVGGGVIVEAEGWVVLAWRVLVLLGFGSWRGDFRLWQRGDFVGAAGGGVRGVDSWLWRSGNVGAREGSSQWQRQISIYQQRFLSGGRIG